MEKNCKWHFDKSGQALTGPNDAIHETFKAHPYYSIVRESIQNSLDAVLDENEPVKVVFLFDKINKENYPNLFELKQHIIACWQTHKDDKQAEKLFHPMSSYIDKHTEIEILKISDYNTMGMNYDPSDYNSGFTSFVRAEGKSSKTDNGSGGSFGFGKGAYYVLSKLKALLVSTKTDTGDVFFEGKARLATHKLDNEIYTRDGFYNKDYDSPVNNVKDIPEYFIREKTGTDIYIIGLIKLEDRKTQMIKSVLNNFWLAIHDNRLIVQIDDVTINHDNLSKIMEDYFEGQFESGAPTEIEAWNPKSYFKAVKYTGTSDQFRVFKETLETLGDVKLYVYLEKGLPNRTSFLRKPKMIVFKGRRNNKVQGYSAVFICENKEGNEILKEMENPAHNEWEPENYLDENDEPHPDAKKAKREISDFINSKLDELSKVKAGKKAAFLGLEEYLSIPEDLAEKEEEYDFEGNNNNAFGKETKEATEDETGMQSTDNEPIKIKPTIKSNSEVKESDDIEQNEDGSERTASGGKNENGGGDQPGGGDLGGSTGDKNEDSPNKSKVFINVGFRSFAQNENNNLYHILIVKADRQIENAELELFVGSDNDREGEINIRNCDSGTPEKNTIKNVKLETGINKIKVQFADNLAHSVKLRAYEIQ